MLGLTRTPALVVLLATAVTAQQPQSGSIAGRVTDTSGGALPGVTIVATGQGQSRKAFLRRSADGTLIEFLGKAFMFPVSNGFTILNYADGAAASGLRANMPVEECLAVFRKILAGGFRQVPSSPVDQLTR